MDQVAFLQENTKGLFPEVLGVRFLEASPERVKASLVVRPGLCTMNNVMPGGAIMAFADTLGGYVTALNLANGAGTTTLRIKDELLGVCTRRRARFRRMLPEGLTYIESWVEPNFNRCFQLMECHDLRLFQEWALQWRGFGATFEIVPVVNSKDTCEVVAPYLDKAEVRTRDEREE